MNRRSFMKAVGVVLAGTGLGLVGSIQAGAKQISNEQRLMDLVGSRPLDVKAAERAFVYPYEWHKHKGYVSEPVNIANPSQMSMMWTGKTNHLPMTIWIKDEGYVSFDAGTLLFDGISGTRDDLKDDFSCRLTFTHRLTGGFNDDMEIYERANLIELLGRCKWSEIKESK